MILRIYIVCIDWLKGNHRFEIQALMWIFLFSFPPL